MSPPRPLPDKLFFRIGEVADIVGVKPHVLRYWESEFSSLRPMKTRGSHRQYRRRDVELAMLIKQLLHGEGYTIAGARKQLRDLGHDRAHAILPETASTEVKLRAALLGLREELVDLLDSLEEMADDEAATLRQVTVHRAVPAPGARATEATAQASETARATEAAARSAEAIARAEKAIAQAKKLGARAPASGASLERPAPVEPNGARVETFAHAKANSPHSPKKR